MKIQVRKLLDIGDALSHFKSCVLSFRTLTTVELAFEYGCYVYVINDALVSLVKDYISAFIICFWRKLMSFPLNFNALGLLQ